MKLLDIHTCFKGVVWVFVGICIYELSYIIEPYYSFFHAVLIFGLISGWYIWYVILYKGDYSGVMQTLVSQGERRISQVWCQSWRASDTYRYSLQLYILVLSLSVVLLAGLLRLLDIDTSFHTYIYITFVGLHSIVSVLLFTHIGAAMISTLKRLFCTMKSISVILTFVMISGVLGYNFIYNRDTSSIDDTVYVSGEEQYTQGDDPEDLIPETEPKIEPEEIQLVQVSELYDIPVGLSVGSSGDGVRLLQEVLELLGYQVEVQDQVFDESMRLTLVEVLQSECAWPDTTQGVFGPQAKACIDGLEIPLN